jgi:hypothetical protein
MMEICVDFIKNKAVKNKRKKKKECANVPSKKLKKKMMV